MSAATRTALVLAIWIIGSIQISSSEELLVTLSDRSVDITSNFTGSSITVFGAIRRDAATVARASDYDVVVTITGPRVDAVTRRKERVFGIWINRSSQVFDDVPSAYSVLSNRPLEDIAHPSVLARLGVDVASLVGSEPEEAPVDDTRENDPEVDTFSRAFLRLQREDQIYQQSAESVSVIDNQLFRARATFPADVPLGNFSVRVLLFSGGVLLSEQEAGILVRKTGFEQFLFSASQTDRLAYGLGVVLLALFTGWLGGVVFRRS